MYSRLFKYVRSIVPRISETELIALRSGTTSVDREIFQGNVNILVKPTEKTNEEKDFSEKTISKVLTKFKDVNQVYPSNKIGEIVDVGAK